MMLGALFLFLIKKTYCLLLSKSKIVLQNYFLWIQNLHSEISQATTKFI